MFVLKVENTRNNILTLTQNESNYQITKIDGLNPPNAIINSSTVAGMDGSIFNSSKLEERNIVLTIKINGEVEKNRLNLYKYFKTKQWCKIYYKNSSRDVYIEGYVETIECDLFELGQTMQISIICQNPYFKALQEIATDISEEMAGFEFPFAINESEPIEFSTIQKNRVTNVINNGEVESGLIIELTASADVSNPAIYNANNGHQFMKIDVDMKLGDKIVINTGKGQKRVTLISNGIETNLIKDLVPIKFGDSYVYPTWFQLQLGDNEFTYTADTGAEFLNIMFRRNTLYEGV